MGGREREDYVEKWAVGLGGGLKSMRALLLSWATAKKDELSSKAFVQARYRHMYAYDQWRNEQNWIESNRIELNRTFLLLCLFRKIIYFFLL